MANILNHFKYKAMCVWIHHGQFEKIVPDHGTVTQDSF